MNNQILKRRAFAAALIVICLAISAIGTLAYYTAEERAHNVITTGGVEIEVGRRGKDGALPRGWCR